MRCSGRALKQQLNGEKWDVEVGHLCAFGWAMLFSCPVIGRLLAWQWHVIDVMYWILYDVKLKWHRRVTERKGRGGEGERELSFGIQINEINKTKQKKRKRSDLGKGIKPPVPNFPGDEWENQSTQEKMPVVRCRENPIDINLHKGSTAVKVQGNITKQKTWGGKKRATRAHTNSHASTCIHTLLRFYSTLQWRYWKGWGSGWVGEDTKILSKA